VFSLLFNGRFRYRTRQLPAVKAFLDHRIRAIERGEKRQVVLGEQFWSRAYPALGLQALSVLPSLVSLDAAADDRQSVTAGSGELVLFARQIIRGSYQDGFSSGLCVALPGPTPLSFLAGFLPELGYHPTGSLGLLGNYGQFGALLTERAVMRGAHTFAAAGSISAQAALFLNVRDLLIGEEVFMLPGLIDPTPSRLASLATEDILRVLLMALLVIAAILKMAGVL